MKTYINNSTSNTSRFIVAINQINNSKTLLPYVLYIKMEELAIQSINPFNDIVDSKPSLKKLNILKNAFLNDKLLLKSSIKKFDAQILELSVKVYKNWDENSEVICNACFRFLSKENCVKKVS